MRGIFNSVSSSVRKFAEDDFVRPDSITVSKAKDGSRWKTIRGSWGITSNKITTALTPTSMSDAPIVAQDFPFKDVSIMQKNVGAGTTTALWVTDENNWWAVGVDSASENCNCTDYACCTAYGCTGYGCTGYGCTATGCTATGCTATGCTATGCTGYGCKSGYGFCLGYGCSAGYGCTGYGCTSYGCTARYSTGLCRSYGCTGYGCTATGCKGFGCTSFGCSTYGCTSTGCTATGCTATGCTATGCTATGCTSSGCTSTGCTENSTCTTCQTCYPKYIKIFKSIASVISTVTSWSPGSTGVAAFRVRTKGSSIKVQAYSDSNGTTAYGDETTYDASSHNPVKTNRFGIMITPATMEQATYSGGIRIDIN